MAEEDLRDWRYDISASVHPTCPWSQRQHKHIQLSIRHCVTEVVSGFSSALISLLYLSQNIMLGMMMNSIEFWANICKSVRQIKILPVWLTGVRTVAAESGLSQLFYSVQSEVKILRSAAKALRFLTLSFLQSYKIFTGGKSMQDRAATSYPFRQQKSLVLSRLNFMKSVKGWSTLDQRNFLFTRWELCDERQVKLLLPDKDKIAAAKLTRHHLSSRWRAKWWVPNYAKYCGKQSEFSTWEIVLSTWMRDGAATSAWKDLSVHWMWLLPWVIFQNISW